MKRTMCAALTLGVMVTVGLSPALAQAGGQARGGRGGGGQFGDRVDVRNMENPIPVFDSVWIEELTMMEVRDFIKAGKTNALILTGGIEENGPYLATGKHNYVLEVMGESIAREMGDTLVAPIVRLEPGDPERENISPGTIYLTRDTFKAVMRDMATSLKSQGFTDIFIMGDSGGNRGPMEEVAGELTATWGDGPAHVYFIPEYYNYSDVRTFQEEELGIHEVMEGLHDDYYISSIMMNADLNSVRTNERIQSGKFIINGVSLAPVEKTLANGRKIIAFRTEATVTAMRKAMGAPTSNQR